MRPDLAALGHARRAEQAHAGADRGVLADRHVRLDARRRRLQKGHPRAGVSLEDAALGALLDLHQPRPVVHPERNCGIVRGVCRHHPPAAHQGRQGAGEIELAVGQADLVERREERRRIEGVGAQVDLADREHGAREALRSLGLDDLLEASIAVAHDAAVAGGVELIGREQRRGGSFGVLRRAQTGDLLRGDERLVTRENHERPALDRPARREHGRGRSLALVLLDRLDPVGSMSATPSPGRTTHSTCSAPASRAASATHSTIGLPQTRCSTLGRCECMRVPWPAAMIRTVKDSAMGS